MKKIMLFLSSLFISLLSFAQFDGGHTISKGLYTNSSVFHDFDENGEIDLMNKYGDMMQDVFTDTPRLKDDENLGPFHHTMFVLDIDNDGHLDIYSPQEPLQPEYLLFGLGDGHFTEVDESINTPASGICNDCHYNVRDINNDGYWDIIKSYSSYNNVCNNTAWYENIAGGGFVQREIMNESMALSASIKIQGIWDDFNGDGLEDMIAVVDGFPFLYTNVGSGIFPETPELVESSIVEISGAISGDVDNDGDADLITYGVDEWAWLENDGYGVFSSPISLFSSTFISYQHLFITYCEDFDNDGWSDLMYWDQTKDDLIIRKNLGDNTFDFPVIVYSGASYGPSFFCAGNHDSWIVVFPKDIDHDGALDIVIDLDNLVVMRNRGEMNFSLPRYTSAGNMRELVVSDINGDGQKDITASCDEFTGVVSVRSGINGLSLFAPETAGVVYPYYNDSFNTINAPTSITANADFDNDGQLEYVFYNNEELFVAKKDIDGYFTKTVLMEIPELEYENTASVFAFDVNNDTMEDIVLMDVSNISLSGMNIWLNLDGINFSNTPIYYNQALQHTQLLDLDNDGDLDLFSMDGILVNGSNSTFEFVPFELLDYSTYLGEGDLNNDGKIDLMFQSSFYINEGDFVFTPMYVPMGIPQEFEPYYNRLELADVDSDGDQDLVFYGSLDFADGELYVMYQTSTLTFDEPQLLFPALIDLVPWIFAFTIEDWNDDLLPDIICYNKPGQGIGELLVFYNTSDSPFQITGHAFYDLNENGVFDDGENILQDIEISSVNQSYSYFTNTTGEYHFAITQLGEYPIEVTTPDFWQPTTNESILSDISLENPTAIYDFGFIPSDAHQGIEVSINATATICNHGQSIWLNYLNEGNTQPDLQIQLTLPNGIAYISSEPEALVNGQTLTWNVSDLAAYAPGQLMVETYIGNDLIPGNELDYHANVLATDETGTGNYLDTWMDMFRCSFDPNDKTEHSGFGESNYVDGISPLIYTVRFQNTGNYFATDVVITDQLSELLDRSTFHPLASSHPVEIALTDDGQATFTFSNIMLPDSTADYLGSQGFVRFEITPIENLPHGTLINNAAEIFFDLNDPIITNTSVSTIYLCDANEAALTSEAGGTCVEPTLTVVASNYWTTNYEWLTNGEIIGNEITLTAQTPGDYWIYLNTSNELCGSSNDSIFVSLTPAELASIQVDDTLLCPSETTVLYSNYENGVSWLLNNSVIGNNASLEVAEAGIYVLHVEIGDCVLAEQQVEVSESPEIFPTIQSIATNSLSTIEGDYTYQWTLNGVLLENETGLTLQITESGEYGVSIMNADDCVYTATGSFLYTQVEELKKQAWTMYPNPASENVLLKWQEGSGRVEVLLFASDGRLIDSLATSNTYLNLDLKELSAGAYSVVWKSEMKGVSRKSLIIR